MISKWMMAACLLTLNLTVLSAGEADILEAKAKKSADGTYQISVTLKHADTGWDHYANAWEVLAQDGTVLATRVLAHPHVNEQPFTRSMKGIKIPEGVSQVVIRGKDSVHEYGGKELTLKIKP